MRAGKSSDNENFSRSLGEDLDFVVASQTHATWGSSVIGAPPVFLEINKEKFEQIRFRVPDV